MAASRLRWRARDRRNSSAVKARGPTRCGSIPPTISSSSDQTPLIRFEGLPGEFSQHDFGQVDVEYVDGATQRIRFFASRLKYPRTIRVSLVPDETTETLRAMDPGANEAPTWLVRTSGHDRHPAVSPNGSWLAFTTEENGQAEVFVQPLSRAGPRRRVSLAGGVSPLWAPDGRRLYWRRGDDVVSVDLDAAGAAQGAPVIRATGTFVSNPPYTSYAVGRDGRLLLARIPPRRPVNTVNVVLNLDVEIERLISEAEAKRWPQPAASRSRSARGVTTRTPS